MAVDEKTDMAMAQWVACPSCDCLYDMSLLRDGDRARCSRCNHFLSFYKRDGFTQVQAYAVSALVFLLLGCSFPFLSFKASGLESVMTLPQTVFQLAEEGMWDLSVIVAGFIIVIPALIMVLIFSLSMALDNGWRRYWLTDVGKLIFKLHNWCMVEVFFIAVLVSLVKISSMATVIIGISFWAYGAFSVCFILAIANLDRYQTWARIEALQL